MSGGAYDYMFERVSETYVGEMKDLILDRMMKDLVEVLYTLEWWQSGDVGEEQYREIVENFKDKYFRKYDETLKETILKEVNRILCEAGVLYERKSTQ